MKKDFSKDLGPRSSLMVAAAKFLGQWGRWGFMALCHGVYSMLVRPHLAGKCRFYPTCFPYCQEAYLTLPLAQAIKVCVWRLMRCHPWGGMGYDPVPLAQKTSYPLQGDMHGKL